ncbi:hypothetical protein [Mycolicibacter hiberniae]|nr:hypothetical protein [Mycolicibacter hiberniae]MCV7086563.1 hypothetical protein [Mycolicibacter hiberniae]
MRDFGALTEAGFVAIEEAASAMGWSTAAVQAAVTAGTLRAVSTGGGGWLVQPAIVTYR